MPGFGCTSTVSVTFPPGAALISAGDAAMSACLDVCGPRNCRLGVPCAKATAERRRMKAEVLTGTIILLQPSYFRLQTSDFSLQPSAFRLQTSHFKLPALTYESLPRACSH